MDWKKCAIEDLRKLNGMRESLESMKERISSLYDAYKSTKCSTSDATPVKGGGNGAEDRLINNIVERDRLKFNYEATQKLVRLIDRGIAGLDDKDKHILDAFYISGHKYCIGRLCEELGYEERQIYRFKDQALYKLTVAMYGITDY